MNEATANDNIAFGSQAEIPKDEMAAFFTREAANDGITVPLLDPKGNQTKHHLILMGARSDAVSKAREEMQRKVMEKDADRQELVRAVLASAVKAWSFEKPCTLENVKAFLKEAPQIGDQIDRAIYNDSNFTKG